MSPSGRVDLVFLTTFTLHTIDPITALEATNHNRIGDIAGWPCGSQGDASWIKIKHDRYSDVPIISKAVVLHTPVYFSSHIPMKNTICTAAVIGPRLETPVPSAFPKRAGRNPASTLSHPWSNSWPKGEPDLVLLACRPSKASSII